MARSRAVPNLLYGTLGLAVAATAGFFAVRALRRRRAHRGEDPMLSLRRSTRDVGRSIKDAGTQVGKDISRGIEDTRESFAQAADASYEPDALNRI